MTLIITFCNCDYITQLSDRRLTSNGKLIEDESNKATVLFCSNGRLAFGFTGLAKSYEFETMPWLLSAIFECSPPDYSAYDIINRLRERATNDFNTIPALKKTQNKDKRLSIIFSGYLYHHAPPLAVYAIMTNYQSFNGTSVEEAREFFTCTYWNEIRPNKDDFTLVQKIGQWPAFNDNDANQIRLLLKKKVPPKSTLDRAIDIVREVSKRPIANGLIGTQLTSITIYRDKTKNIETGYHSEIKKHEIVMPSIVYAKRDNHTIIDNFRVRAVNSQTSLPMVYPKVPRRRPCPCGSGKKYKNCHGKIKQRIM